MPIRVALFHKTLYEYDRPIMLGPQVVRLRPAPHCRTNIRSYVLRVHPQDHFLNWQQDPHANYLARLVFEEKTRSFSVEVELTADIEAYDPFEFFLEPEADHSPFEYEPTIKADLEPFLRIEPPSPKLGQLIEQTKPTPGIRTIDYLVDVNRRLANDIEYLIRLEPGVQTPEETLNARSGSCRDTAWLLVKLLRHHGFATRFASGYLIQLKPDEVALSGPKGPTEDFTDLHAWTEVYLPGAGWVGLDPTSGLFAGEGHLPLACTPEPRGAAPISGAIDECEATLDHVMRVERIYEEPRVTRPYTDGVWHRIQALGDRIEEDLQKQDVRLTMGGEPTFVAETNQDDPEWETEALGPTKRRYADKLLDRLCAHFAPQGLRHFGQGKWYPGEPLPRWSNACYFRRDGQPLWRDARWSAAHDAQLGHGPEEAQAFINRLAERLEVDGALIMPAHEDPFYYAWRERRLPANVDPFDNRLENEQERARMVRLFRQGLDAVSGYVLPLGAYYPPGSVRFYSGRWFFRDERLYLMPGDSPIGYRLPIDSLPWTAEEDMIFPQPYEPFPAYLADNWRERWGRHAPIVFPGEQAEKDLEARSEKLKNEAATHARTPWGAAWGAPWPWDGDPASRPPLPTEAPPLGQSAAGLVRTALCVEARDGVLHMFMPPLEHFDAYARVCALAEATCEELSLPIRIEGYPPPFDPRIDKLSVTPDPGVIEVNIHPAHSWTELQENTRVLYREAREVGLRTTKFEINGTAIGTGGGNHITLGGYTPSDSPLLRRPDLLRSLVGYWQDHPSLSYLFSGLFIGPTSQAPRIDEARHEGLHELEVAFAQVPDHADVPPWLVDRIFRHLLTDLTGNTHRAEFCIDKLYSPDAASGRLGLLELRAFEMPPHTEMSLVQQLLVRAMVARFWQRPYQPRLSRWGTQLHDRFMLPYFVEHDFNDVLDQLQEAGYHFDYDWFAPHIEFRFPRIGEVAYDGVQLEVRRALEPWHVLGEQPQAGATARYVDASLERLQVLIRGALPDRHTVWCNGEPVPMHPTGTQGEYVAGVRFRAWQPDNCLHPTIGVHAPLIFDLVDRARDRALGGCTYHVSHPGGRNWDLRPVNEAEAESRRRSRFTPFGHTPGKVIHREARRDRDFPLTLDLRRTRNA